MERDECGLRCPETDGMFSLYIILFGSKTEWFVLPFVTFSKVCIPLLDIYKFESSDALLLVQRVH